MENTPARKDTGDFQFPWSQNITDRKRNTTLHMDESQINNILSKIPGSKRAAQGVLIPFEDGSFYHVQGIISKDESEGLSTEETFFCAFCSKNEILRLRNLRGAHDYLLRLRANALVDSPRAVRVMRERRKEIEKSGRHWSLSQYYHSKDHYHKSYIGYLSRNNAKILKGIPAGLAFIPEANAVCIRSLAGDVVIASESLEYFYYFMSIAFYGSQLGIHLIDREHAVLIAVRIMSGVEALDFEIDPRAILPLETERTINTLVKHQMQFTFGHEYAHHLCGHMSSPETCFDAISPETSIFNRNALRLYNYDLEYQADLNSLKNIQNDPNAYAQVAMGAFSVLLYLHFLHDVWEKLGLNRFSVSETHPSAIDRLKKLLQGLGKKSPVSEKELEDSLALSNDLSAIFVRQLERGRDDALTFYGSVYLPSYISKLKRDRIDF